MFHGSINAISLADQLEARFNDRFHRTRSSHAHGSAVVQIGSKHGTPVTLAISDTIGGVLVTMSRDRDWLDRVADTGEMIERAASGNLISLLAMIPDIAGEIRKDNIAPAIWDAVNDICSLSRALAGEKNAPKNPKVCNYCQTANDPEAELCQSCGSALPVDLPRTCPKCERQYTSDALFCQACGTRLVNG